MAAARPVDDHDGHRVDVAEYPGAGGAAACGFFSADVEIIQLTISLYIVGLALAQLMCGPLSDRFGRRPVILAGFALATCASLGAIVATSANMFILMRVLQAIGGATGVAIGRAIIRDLFGRDRSAQMLSLVASAMAVAPMVAPLVGGVLDRWFGWQAIFLLAGASLLVFGWTATTSPETRPDRTESQGGFITDLRSAARVQWSLHRLRAGCRVGLRGVLRVVGGGTHVVITMMRRSPTEYGAWFLAVSGGYILGNVITSRLSLRYGVDRNAVARDRRRARWGRDRHCVDVRRRNARIDRGRGRANPDLDWQRHAAANAIAGAVSVRPLAAGAASGLLGCTQMLFGAVMAQIAGHLATGATTAWPIIIR